MKKTILTTPFIKKSMISLVVSLLLAAFTAAPSVMAADATISVDIASAYVWRGQTFNDGLVFQPSLDVSSEKGFGFNVWGNYDHSDYDNTLDSHEFSEVDLTAYYDFSLSQLDVGIGVISYLFPAGGEETAEVYLSLGMEIVEGLSAGITGYYDFDAIDEFSYANFGLAYAYDLTEQLGLELAASIGYAGDKFAKNAGGDDGGLYEYTLSLSAGYALTEAWSFSASVNYVDAVDDDHLKERSEGGLLDTNTYFSVGVSYSF